MKRMRLATTHFVAVLAVSALTASPATAVEPHFEFHGSGLPPVEVSITMPTAPTFFYAHGVVNPIVECQAARGKGEILNTSGIGHINAIAITYEECSVPGYELTCKINSSNKHGSIKIVGVKGQLGVNPAATFEVLLHIAPTSGNFTEITLSGTCPLAANSYPIEKGVISEIPGLYIGTALSSFRTVYGLNATHEQLFKEIENPGVPSSAKDELNLGPFSGTPFAISGKLEFKLVGSDTVTIT
jgi:hypothetical protein